MTKITKAEWKSWFSGNQSKRFLFENVPSKIIRWRSSKLSATELHPRFQSGANLPARNFCNPWVYQVTDVRLREFPTKLQFAKSRSSLPTMTLLGPCCSLVCLRAHAREISIVSQRRVKSKKIAIEESTITIDQRKRIRKKKKLK